MSTVYIVCFSKQLLYGTKKDRCKRASKAYQIIAFFWIR